MATITSRDLDVGDQSRSARQPLTPTRVDRLVRADDQLRLTIEFLNLDVDPTTNTLVRVDPTEPFTGVRLVFGSQLQDVDGAVTLVETVVYVEAEEL